MENYNIDMKLSLMFTEPTVSKVPTKHISPRIEELARPMINNVLSTLREKACVLSPAFVDNLTRIIEVKTCINPEEAARVLRRKKCKKEKAKRFPPFAKKWAEEITKVDSETMLPILDKNEAVCQYLLATNFVRSIIQRQCQTRRKDLRKIARVILKRLTSIDEYANARNGNDDRVTQQLHLLAETIACWIAEILVEVAEADKEALEEYCKKKKMKRIDVDDDEETDSEAEYWEQMEEKYETQEKSEDILEGREEAKEIEDVEQEQEPEKDIKRKAEDEDVEKKVKDEEVLEGDKEENKAIET